MMHVTFLGNNYPRTCKESTMVILLPKIRLKRCKENVFFLIIPALIGSSQSGHTFPCALPHFHFVDVKRHLSEHIRYCSIVLAEYSRFEGLCNAVTKCMTTLLALKLIQIVLKRPAFRTSVSQCATFQQQSHTLASLKQ